MRLLLVRNQKANDVNVADVKLLEVFKVLRFVIWAKN